MSLASLLCVGALLSQQSYAPEDRDLLTRGVTELVAPKAWPGVLSVSGSGFVFATGTAGKGQVPVMAAAAVEKGRAVALSHEGFLSEEALKNPSNLKLLGNVLSWASRKPVAGLRVGLMGFDSVATALQSSGATVSKLRVETLSAASENLDVVMATMGPLDNSPGVQALLMRMTRGGKGLVLASPGWGWNELHPDKQILSDHPGNQMLFRYGLAFTRDFANGPFLPLTADSTLFNTDGALAALKAGGLVVGDRATAVATLDRALNMMPPDAPGLPQQIARLAKTEPGDGIASKSNPLDLTKPFSRLNARLTQRMRQTQTIREIQADPSAAFFPGSVDPSVPRVDRSVTIDTSVPEWHSTGFYAAPGEVINVSLPDGASDAGLRLRIGPHTDTLWSLESWPRFPEISKVFPLSYDENQAVSAFGGTLYIEVPAKCRLGKISVGFKHVVPAAWYIKGQTTNEQWQEMISSVSAPWVELQGDLVILSVPLASAKKIADPAALMDYWDQVLKECYRFYAAPRRPFPQRYCTDVEISAGYMHSGYPIMTHLDVADTMCTLKSLLSKGKSWGFYHEMGHNFQVSAWTWAGTGEVTNNLFSLYASERLNRITPRSYGEAHPAMAPAKVKERLQKYLTAGARYEDWKRDPFLALSMFAQLRQGFGWEPFTRFFSEVQEMPVTQWPTEDIAKRDMFMVRFSKLVHKNLGPFFQAWGVPTSSEARASISGLPEWMPSDWPGKSK